MKPPEPSSDAQEFEQALQDMERSLQELKARHTQVQQDQQRQVQLQERRDRIKQEPQPGGRSELKAELKRIQSQLDELEVNLESRLFTWGSLKEPFWQIVRFGGLGLVIGWFFAFATLQQPEPASQPSLSNPALPDSTP